MKIGIAVAEKDLNKEINQTFGRAPMFLIYDSETKEEVYLENEALNAAGGAGIKSSQFIVDNNVDVVICYRLGENAVKVLEGANVKLYNAVDKSVRENINLFLNNKLTALNDIHSGYHHSN